MSAKEIDNVKIVVNGEQYEAYKGTLQEEIKKQDKYIEMLQNNIEKLVEEKIELQDKFNKQKEILDKIKEYIKENNHQEPWKSVQGDYILKLLEEIKKGE